MCISCSAAPVEPLDQVIRGVAAGNRGLSVTKCREISRKSNLTMFGLVGKVNLE